MALMPEEPKQKNALLVAILAIAGLYFFNTYIIAPKTEQAETLEARLEVLENQNRRAQIIATRGGAELEARLALYESHIEQLEKLIPRDEEVSDLLLAISMEERRNGVEVTLMRPEPMEAGSFYDRWSYELGVQGEYHNVGAFLASIASLERIIASVDMEIIEAPRNPSSPKEESGMVQARFRIQTYVVSDRPPPAPAEETQAGD